MNARVPSAALNAPQALEQVSQVWDRDIVHRLEDYIRIPAKSPLFDADWANEGYIDTVVRNTATGLEALWQICASLQRLGYPVVVLDGTALETEDSPGLLHLLQQTPWNDGASMNMGATASSLASRQVVRCCASKTSSKNPRQKTRPRAWAWPGATS